MRRLKWFRMLLSVVLCFGLLGVSSAFAEEDEPGMEEAVGTEEAAVVINPQEFFAGLEEMEFDELTFKVVKIEVVAGNSQAPDDHFRTVVLFQNTSPYTIGSPATAIELIDKEFNQLALKYIKLDGVALKPGESKWVPIEFESLVEVTAGESTKGVRAGMFDVLYGERIDDTASEITKAGAYIFVNSKLLKVKIADPHGYQYVPVKNLLEAIGFKYVWTAKTSTFVATKGNLKIEHKIGSRNLKVNGKIVKIGYEDTRFVSKVPSITVNLLTSITSNWIVTKGYHDDITIVAIADKEIMK